MTNPAPSVLGAKSIDFFSLDINYSINPSPLNAASAFA
jgi:hypothetical protein